VDPANLLPSDVPLWAFVVGVPVLWCGTSFSLSAISGWFRLGQMYKTDLPRSAGAWGTASGWIGMVAYVGCLVVSVDKTGIRLAVWLPLRLCHPPLLLPWRALRIEPPTTRLWGTKLTLTAAGVDTEIKLCGKNMVDGIWGATRTWAPELWTPPARVKPTTQSRRT
jgi:hypothetical protein